MFPLELVAFPGVALPLHIFEPRYREMVGEAEANGTEFGMVPARDGGLLRVGCTVAVETMLQRYPDGRFDVLTRGRRRFEIQAINEDKEYLQGEVEYFEDSDSAPAARELRVRALQAWHELRRDDETELSGAAPDVDNPLLSFRIAPALRDLDLQNTLLMLRSETERLSRIVEHAPRYLERKHYVARMQKLAPANGKGHKPAAGE